jgi:hypothetical protein
VPGGIHIVTVDNIGSGYSGTPTVAITGDGTGATAHAVVVSNTVKQIIIDTPGQNYTYANVVLTGGGGSNAAGTAIIESQGGHGSNAVYELSGFFVSMNIVLTGTLTDFPQTNQYRQISLIQNPFNYGTTTIATSATMEANEILTLNVGFTGTFAQDEQITGGTSTAMATVVSWDSANRKLRILRQKTDNPTTFTIGETISGGTSGATGVISGIANPSVAKYSGHLLYYENRIPIPRDPGQSEVIVLVLDF